MSAAANHASNPHTAWWTVEEKSSFTQSHGKAQQIQGKIDRIMADLIRSPLLAEKYPDITSIIITWLSLPEESQESKACDCKLQSFAQDALTGKVSDNDLQCKIDQEIDQFHQAAKKGDLPYEKYKVLRNFMATLENAPQSTQSSSEPSMLSEFQRQKGFVQLIDYRYLATHLTALDRFSAFFTPAEHYICQVSKAVLPADALSNHIAFTEIIIEKEQKEIRESFRKNRYRKNCKEEIDSSFRLNRKFRKAKTIDEQFRYAQRILNASSMDSYAAALPVRLRALYIMSKKSSECPQFFQYMAKTLAMVIQNFDLEPDEADARCAIQ